MNNMAKTCLHTRALHYLTEFTIIIQIFLYKIMGSVLGVNIYPVCTYITHCYKVVIVLVEIRRLEIVCALVCCIVVVAGAVLPCLLKVFLMRLHVTQLTR